MRWALLLLLGFSLAFNVHLLRPAQGVDHPKPEADGSRVGARVDPGLPDAVAPGIAPAAEAPPGAPLAGLRADLARRERELAEAQEMVAVLAAVGLSDAESPAPRDLRSRLLAAAGLERPARGDAVHEIVRGLRKDRDVAGLVALLCGETDGRILGMLPDLVGQGALAEMLSPVEVERVFEVLERGDSVERRSAAAGIVRSFVFSFPPERWAERVAGALRAEADPAVLDRLARAATASFDGIVPPAVTGALRDALPRLPAGEGRRGAWQAIGATALATDGGIELDEAWRVAGTPDLRDDLATAIAWMAPIRVPPPPAPQAPRPWLAEIRERFVSVYAATADPALRAELVRAARPGRMWLVPASGREAAELLRALSRQEPDPAFAERLGRLAGLVEQGLDVTGTEADAALRGPR